MCCPNCCGRVASYVPARCRRRHAPPVAGIDPGVGRHNAQAGKTAFPRRLAVVFMANGINPNNWWARGSGAAMELGPSLEPLLPFRERLNFIGGLFNEAATNVGIHPGQTGNLLSGVPLMKGPEIRGGISFDQVLANRLGESSVQPSLVLGCEQPTTGYHETNFSMAYGSHISWASADVAGADGSVSVARLRLALREPRRAAHPQHPRSGAWSRRPISAGGPARRIRRSWTSI